MTGSQPHPGTGVTLMGPKRKPLSIPRVLEALGFGCIVHADPLDLDASVAAAREALDYEGPSAVLFESPCIQLVKPGAPAVVDPATCTGCKKCITEIGCPAVGFDADAIVVLGASVFADGTPSGILQDRLDDGIALYKAGVAPKLIMSGDNSTVSYNEVQVMKDYAISQGVPSQDIFCDHAGFSTYESMYRAKNVFGAQRIVVATQTYHLYRALYAAQGLGLEAIGVEFSIDHG